MLSRLITTIGSTFYNPAFYNAARKGSYHSPIKITAFLGSLGSLVLMVSLYGYIAVFAIGDPISRVEAVYPSELAVTLANGEASINMREPYAVPNPSFGVVSGVPKNLVLFDTKDTLKGGAADNNTVVLVKKTYAVIENSLNERTISFSTIATSSTTTLTKADIETLGTAMRPYVMPTLLLGGAAMLVLAGLSVTFGWLGFHLLYLVIPTVFLFMYGKFRIPEMEWKESYIVAVYASIPVAIATFLLHLLGYSWPVFFYTFMVVTIALINLVPIPNQVPKEFRHDKLDS